MKDRPKYYVLDEQHNPQPCDLMTWAMAFESNRRVALTQIAPRVSVSTIFLGLDHNWGMEGPPVLFETMVCGGPLNQQMERYCTWEQAERGHAEWVKRAKGALN